MSIQHVALTDPNLHEPKGASTAADGTIYVSNGVGSGVWEKVDTASLKGLTGDGGSNNSRIITDGTNGFTLHRDAAYGSMTITNNSNPIALLAAADPTLQSSSDYVLLTGVGAPWVGENTFGISVVSDRIIVPVTGVYSMDAWANISQYPTNTSFIGSRFRINGSAFTPRVAINKSNSAGDQGQINAAGIAALNANDYLQLYVASSAAGNLIIRNFVITLSLVRQTA